MDYTDTSDSFQAVADVAGLSAGFEALFQAAPSPFLVVTPPNFTIIAVNDAYLDETMTQRHAIMGRGLFEVFPEDPDDPISDGVSMLRASFQRVIASRQTDTMAITRYPIPRPEPAGGGFELRYWSPRNAPVLGPDGNIVCIIHHVVDVTARVRAEDALRASEEKFRSLFESIDEGFCIIEVAFDQAGKAIDYRFLEINPAFERQSGISGAVGRWMREIAPAHEEYWFENYGRIAMTGEPRRFDGYAAAQLGRTFDAYAFRTGDPAARRVAILFTDITERMRAQAALRESEQRLLAAVRDRDELLKEVHHRVKNNLQVITSLLELQNRQGGEEQTTAFSEARNRITAISAIHELLYQSGSFSEVNLAQYARRLLRHVASLYDANSRVDASVDGEGITIDLARAVPLGLLLNELVANAYKHAFPSKSKGELRVEFRVVDSHIRMQVKDNGAGFSSEVTSGVPATLGLHLIRMLAKQLGGNVTFHSDAGTHAEVLIPVEAHAS